MEDSRRLAVIMFADIVGYTSLIREDESLAFEKLNRFKEELQVKVEEANGQIIQYFGDGAVVIFKNSVDAMHCTQTLQQIFWEPPQVPVRIGVHLGDVLFKEGNIFGDSVNITSRIESMGIPGAVLLSSSVQKEIRNKPEFKVSSLGSFEFKNVDEPMEVFALRIKNLPVPVKDELRGKFKEQKTVRSIAVLPFVNMSNDPEQEYFSEGISEEIINSLSHLEDLNVAGRTSSFQFKGNKADLRVIGKKLHVDCILEGSVRKQNNKLRITAQLINVADGFHLWSDRFDREISDVFAIQDEIALAVTRKLRIILGEEDHRKIIKAHTTNTNAYEMYLKGKFYVTRRGSALIAAIQSFQQAIQADPDFALAHSAYADANLLLATYGLARPADVMELAKQSAERAIELDETLCEPHCALGYYYASFEWQQAAAKMHFERCLELNPSYAEGHFRYGWNYLTCIEGNFEKGIEHGEIAIKLEPLSSLCHATHSLTLHCAGKYEEALRVCQIAIELDPSSFVANINFGMICIALSKYETAIACFEILLEKSNRHHFVMNALIWTYCLSDKKEEGMKLLGELRQRSLSEYISKTFTGLSCAYLGDLDGCFELLDQAYHEKDPVLIMLKYENWVPVTVRSDQRFDKLLERIGFVQGSF